MAEITRLGVIIFPGFALLDAAGPLQFFNQFSGRKPLELSILAKTLDPVSTIPPKNTAQHYPCSFVGQSMLPTHTFDKPPEQLDILIVPGGLGVVDETIRNETAAFIKAQYSKLKYLLSVCNGSIIVAETGLLDGKKATSNKSAWSSTSSYPNVNWVPKARWVVDGNIWSSSGVASGMDMTYAFISSVFSIELAKHIANVMEYEPHVDPDWDPFSDIWSVSSK